LQTTALPLELCPQIFCCFCFWDSSITAQASLRPLILLSPPLNSWDYGCVSPHPDSGLILNSML
jgi:hypothetical protein